MYLPILYTFFTVILCCFSQNVDVPTVTGSFRAIGEIIIEFEGMLVTFAFEENFDKTTSVTSFWSSLAGTNTTILEYQLLQQTFMFNPQEPECTEVREKDWDNTTLSPNLKAFEVKGQVVFPLKQLLSLNASYLETEDRDRPAISFRGVMANRFSFNINNIGEMVEVEAYWSDKLGGSSPSRRNEVPLSYEVIHRKTAEDKPVVMRMNIFLFIHDEVNQLLLQPPRGMFCPGRRDPTPFPTLKDFQTFALSAEIVLQDKNLVTALDSFVDFKNGLYRSDLTPLESLSGEMDSKRKDFTPQSMVVALDQGAVFHMGMDGSKDCRVSPLDKEPYYPQMIFDPRKKSNWEPEVFLGTSENKYVRVGQVEERDVVCTLYQALRSDWPPGEEGKVQSIWEWCFADGIEHGDTDLEETMNAISLNIYVTKSPYEDGSNKPYKGQRLIYNLYHVRSMPSHYMGLLAFDISSCFVESRQQKILFLVDLSDDDRKVVLNLVNYVEFDVAWRNSIYEAAELSTSSLRVAKLRTSLQEQKGPLIVEMTILDHHPDLSEDIRKSTPSLDTAIKSIEKAIENARLKISWKSGEKTLELSGRKGSFKKPDFSHAPSPPPAFYKFQQAEGDARSEREEEGRWSPASFWILGVVALQVGVAVAVTGVAYKKLRRKAIT